MQVAPSLGGGGCNIGVLIIRIGFWGIFYCNHNKDPPPPPNPMLINSTGLVVALAWFGSPQSAKS